MTDFDPERWLDYRDARRFDRVGQLAVAAGDLAIEDRGGRDGIDPDTVATIVSSGLGGPATLEQAARAQASGDLVPPTFIPMAMTNFAASAIARRFGFGGRATRRRAHVRRRPTPSGRGYRMIHDGYVTTAVVGGAEAPVTPLIVAGFAGMRALSRRNDNPPRACRPFDAERDGFVLGEGAAVLVLESLGAARQRGAHIYAEVCGYGQTNDTHHVPAPREDGRHAAGAMTQAMTEAGLVPATSATSTRTGQAPSSPTRPKPRRSMGRSVFTPTRWR